MKRPTSVLVFGILNLIFAAMGVFGLLGSAAMLLATQSPDMQKALQNNPVLQLIQQNHDYALFIKISTLAGVAATVVLALGGVGLLLLRSWGRYLSIVYAFYAIVATMIGAMVNYHFLIAPMLEKVAHARPGPEQGALVGGVVGGLFGTCFGMIYPVLLLIFMYRPNVVAAFEPPGDEEIAARQ
jgi:hypothetical protein